MRNLFKKAVAVVAAVGAVTVGGASIASAATADTVTVPDVTGYSAPAAVQVLENAGFTNVVVSGPYAHDTDTTVTRTSLAASTTAVETQPITVFVNPW
ncbi:PASTA domain-containing protein [Rhodococcoides kyotonense]|uniref:PASTA domain-containing protein n=1 Tax=Rhodococcoides kyotonense TaxID=398843 RepID=A0A239MI67_9NOCA|nr:PASTA domain-containing protein [Rhodococcus kyotonensis]SNT41638.1 PASTA domain-containing protein [Rhodococcus kyotonensis]